MENFNFEYLIEKINKTEFSFSPFKHIYIENFFSDEHFDQIVKAKEIRPPQSNDDIDLIDNLCHIGFKVIDFPGCTSDVDKYLEWRRSGKNGSINATCEGFGVVLRLQSFSSPIIESINNFFQGDSFNAVCAEKFQINLLECYSEGGIQKYLDGYEISPHSDIRKKATTFMVNINPDPISESLNHHTHYLRFSKPREYVQRFWEENPDVQRAWVPWSWCETVKQQKKNNSIVLFSPSNDTLHGVLADYDHLKTQRTQLYGNLWYREDLTKSFVSNEQLDLLNR